MLDNPGERDAAVLFLGQFMPCPRFLIIGQRYYGWLERNSAVPLVNQPSFFAGNVGYKCGVISDQTRACNPRR